MPGPGAAMAQQERSKASPTARAGPGAAMAQQERSKASPTARVGPGAATAQQERSKASTTVRAGLGTAAAQQLLQSTHRHVMPQMGKIAWTGPCAVACTNAHLCLYACSRIRAHTLQLFTETCTHPFTPKRTRSRRNIHMRIHIHLNLPSHFLKFTHSSAGRSTPCALCECRSPHPYWMMLTSSGSAPPPAAQQHHSHLCQAALEHRLRQAVLRRHLCQAVQLYQQHPQQPPTCTMPSCSCSAPSSSTSSAPRASRSTLGA